MQYFVEAVLQNYSRYMYYVFNYVYITYIINLSKFVLQIHMICYFEGMLKQYTDFDKDIRTEAVIYFHLFS